VCVCVCDTTYTTAVPIAIKTEVWKSKCMCVPMSVHESVFGFWDQYFYYFESIFHKVMLPVLESFKIKNSNKTKIIIHLTHPCVIHISLQCVYVQNSRSNTTNACSNQTQWLGWFWLNQNWNSFGQCESSGIRISFGWNQNWNQLMG